MFRIVSLDLADPGYVTSFNCASATTAFSNGDTFSFSGMYSFRSQFFVLPC